MSSHHASIMAVICTSMLKTDPKAVHVCWVVQMDRDGTVLGDGDDSSSDEEGGDMDMDDAPPQAVPLRPEPVVDEDGFMLVQGKGKPPRGHR